MTVFSCRVKGLLENPRLDVIAIHDRMKKYPSNPADTFSDGMTPTVRLSLWVMMEKKPPSTTLSTSDLMVICSHQGGTAVSAHSSTENCSSPFPLSPLVSCLELSACCHCPSDPPFLLTYFNPSFASLSS
ncbi:hypothetical protein O6H91_20G021500 [Diphasiastrum complanatum]|uniref:Uncharacterized protein n=1 Tax=Diphasiastrum complanatum TaxID=34168 RepID=A0ACC2ANF3_DIPCM|nr:hypothetical protein O6H91_20G021500 [Diphasiastrum complanatum]